MGTFVTALVLVIIIALIVISIIRGRKKGKSSCGGQCSGCTEACSSSCHTSSRKNFNPLILEIDGMMCSMCESHVNDAIRNNFKVKSIKSSYKTGAVSLVSEESIDIEKLCEVLKKEGYRVKKVVQ